MKKSFLFAGLAVIAALTACDKAEIAVSEPAAGRTVSIFANPADDDTKTANDGLHTTWAEGDALNVFAAPAGTTTYGDNLQFTLAEKAAGKFYGTASLTEDAYDWYVLYPYNKKITTPGTQTEGYTEIGSKASSQQTQEGNDSKAHLAGTGFPLYGQVKNVAKDVEAVVPMHHLVSVVAVKVKNGTAAPVKINQIVFTASEDIVGTYYINFAEAKPVLVSSGANFVSKSATLKVSSAAEIAPAGTATFYMAVKPFTAGADAALSLDITGSNGVQTKKVTPASALAFAAGHIKTLNVTYDKELAPELDGGWVLVEDIATLTEGAQVVLTNSDATYVMAEDRGANRLGVEISSSESKKTVAVKDTYQIIDIEKTGDNFYLKVGDDKYLYASGGKDSNQLKTDTKANVANKGVFTISIADGNATIKAIDTDTERNTIRFNGSNNPPLFSCYASGQQDVRFYYKAPGSTVTAGAKKLATPQNLNIVVSNLTQIDATWDAVENAAEYRIEVSPAISEQSEFNVRTNFFNHINLPYSTTYTFKVYAVPATNDTEHLESDPATKSATTGDDPNSNEVKIIIDGSKLGTTATAEVSTLTYSDLSIVFSDSAKQIASSGEKKFTDKAILIGKTGKYIYNSTPIPGKITKFEIYANKGASAKVTVGVNFSNTAIASFNPEASNTFAAKLGTPDSVYDCSASLSDDCRYFWYQVTNDNNSQVEFRITYIPD